MLLPSMELQNVANVEDPTPGDINVRSPPACLPANESCSYDDGDVGGTPYLPDTSPVPQLHDICDAHVDVSMDDSDEIECLFACAWDHLPAPCAAPDINEEIEACAVASFKQGFSSVWDKLLELDCILGELAFRVADAFPDVPVKHKTVLSLAELIPVSEHSECGEITCSERLSDTNLHVFDCVSTKLQEFREGMYRYIDFVWEEWYLADALRDEVPVLLDGSFFDSSLHVAFEIFCEIEGYSRPTLTEVFETCDYG